MYASSDDAGDSTSIRSLSSAFDMCTLPSDDAERKRWRWKREPSTDCTGPVWALWVAMIGFFGTSFTSFV